MSLKEKKLCIVGLGYVGLPLAHAFAEEGYVVTGFDVNEERIAELKKNKDRTGELTSDQLSAVNIEYSSDPSVLAGANIIIVALPTPIDAQNKPDLSILKAASKTIGQHMKKGVMVVYESTVYPGVTEEVCGPILEKHSGLHSGTDFTLGYSPERINPGDKQNTVRNIIKIVAGQDEKATDLLCDLYKSIITAGIHRAPNIKVAEMSKAIENAQRDLNIAFINEVALLCDKIGIDTKDVLAGAKTKWNFLPFHPGLVGGHCIGVDPYYLVEKAHQLGMDTQVMTAGRTTNDSMAQHIAEKIDAALAGQSSKRVLVLGLTFKENVPDTRNSKSYSVVKALKDKGCDVDVHDPLVPEESTGSIENSLYDAIALLVPHNEYKQTPTEYYCRALHEEGVIFDLRGILKKEEIVSNNKIYLSL